MISKYRPFLESKSFKRKTLKDVLKVTDSLKYKDDVIHLLEELGDSSYYRYTIEISMYAIPPHGDFEEWEIYTESEMVEEWDGVDNFIQDNGVGTIFQCVGVCPKEENDDNENGRFRIYEPGEVIKSQDDLDKQFHNIDRLIDLEKNSFEYKMRVFEARKELVRAIKRIKNFDQSIAIYQSNDNIDEYYIIFT